MARNGSRSVGLMLVGPPQTGAIRLHQSKGLPMSVEQNSRDIRWSYERASSSATRSLCRVCPPRRHLNSVRVPVRLAMRRQLARSDAFERGALLLDLV
jgi:hypothetical protein